MTGPEKLMAPRTGVIADICGVLTLVVVGVSLQATLGSEDLATLAPPSQAKVDIIYMLNDVLAMAWMGGIRARALVLVGFAEAAGYITIVLGDPLGVVESVHVAPEKVLLERHKPRAARDGALD
jgi:hypothetical protein